MTRLSKARGIVIHRRRVRESDSIVRILTDAGQSFEFWAHGIHSSLKNRTPLLIELGSLICIDYYESTRGVLSLKEGVLENRFEELKKEYNDVTLLSYFLDLTSFIASYEASLPLFMLLSGSIDTLCHSKRKSNHKSPLRHHPQTALLIIFFQIRLLKLLGLVRVETRCILCDNFLNEKAHLNLPELSFSCKDCSPESTQEHFQLAELISSGASHKFGKFAKYWTEQTSKLDLPKTYHRLHLSLQDFRGREFSSFPFLDFGQYSKNV